MRNPRNDRLGSDTPKARAAEAPSSPVRRCILSGEHDARDALVRLALSPDGEVLPDALARAPGRGAWIGIDRDALETAVARGKLKGALARAFKGAAVTIPADLGQRTEAALARAVTDRLGLELRSGRLLLGAERIEQAARNGRVAWLAHAADAGSDGSRRLDQAWRVGREAVGSRLGGTVLPLDRATLSVALGRDNVVHLALTDSAAADRLAVPLGRLMRFLGRDRGSGDRPAADPTRQPVPRAPHDDMIDDKDVTV